MNFLNGSFRVGRLFDIDIHVHFFFLLWAAFRLMSDPSIYTFGFLAMLYLIVLVHEFGHCFGARSVGGDAQHILMWPLGGLAYAYAPQRPWPQFVTVAAGPLVNVIFCLLSGIVLAVFSGGFNLDWLNPLGQMRGVTGPQWLIWVVLFYKVNLFLLAFNLLPIYPLDGGQLFHAIIWPFVGLYRATTIACQVGIGGAIVMLVLGVQWGQPILFLIAIFGGFTCWQRLQAAKHGMLVEDSQFEQVRYRPRPQRQSVFSKLGGLLGGGKRPETNSTNPNPGGWQAKQAERQKKEEELDRILQKVRDRGLASLTYVEQQKLKKATEERQKAERRFDQDSTL